MRMLLPNSAQETQSYAVRISERHPALEIRITVRVRFRERLLNPASIGFPPSIPEHLLPELWLNSGMCIGVYAAFQKFENFLDQITVEVDFPSLSFSIDLEELLEDEIELLASQLERITEDLVNVVLARLTSEV